MKIKPLRDWVVLKPLSQEEKTKSGIILPDTAQEEKPEQAKVMAYGSEVEGLQRDDTVLFAQYSPQEVEIKGNKLLVIKEEDVLAVIS